LVKYTLTGPVTATGFMPFSTTGLPAGSYILNMIGKCGDSICKTCRLLFTIKCDTDCCIGSHWVEGPFWTPTAVVGVAPTLIQCGISNFTISNALGNCNTPITISGSWACGGTCAPSVSIKVVNATTNVIVLTGTGSLTIPTTLANGSYIVTMYGYCGTKICDSCKFRFTKNCLDCCKGSKWLTGPNWINVKTGVSTLIKCGTSVFPITNTNGLCFVPFKVSGTFGCAAGCVSQVTYELKDSVTGLIISTSNDSLNIPISLANGTFIVTIRAYCGGTVCQTCTFKITKNCSCDCGPATAAISVNISTNGVVKAYKCAAVLPIINCKDNVVMNGSYTCNQADCPAAYSYVLNGPFGTTTGSLPLTLSSLVQGSYSININAYCGGVLCKTCTYNFTVVCDSVPPPNCCPYDIVVTAATPTYTVTPTANAIIANQLFNVSGLAGVPLSEVKAEVLSYDLSSNFMNECLGCKSYPYTWASTYTGTNIGAVIPKITLYGAATTTLFNPTGTAIYQNPREIIWNNGSPFVIPGNIGISFLLPPAPIIDCCVLSGKICVKFTFKDTKCHECEVIACFSFQVTKDNRINFARD
jgi:hypothetical protein